MGGVFRGRYPRELGQIVAHAERLAKVLTRMEAKPAARPWVVGRSGELRAVVSCAVSDWRGGACDDDGARARIAAYVEELHRGAAKKLGGAASMACCASDESVASVPEDETRSEIGGTGERPENGWPDSDTSTAEGGWVDSPEVIARVHGELARVDILARVLSRRIGNGCATLDDLRGFGREGLLAAARSFDDGRGVPFGNWAALRIQRAMLDGVRSWRNLPRRVCEELDTFLGAYDEPARPRSVQIRDSAETSFGWRRREVTSETGAPGTVTVAPAGRIDATPEEVVAKAELLAQVRRVVERLPTAERDLVKRHYFDGQTVDQAAAAGGIGKSWASRLLARAMKTIEQELREHDSSWGE
jgi:RNA polymerase sigma factor for flagellar operon FliA